VQIICNRPLRVFRAMVGRHFRPCGRENQRMQSGAMQWQLWRKMGEQGVAYKRRISP